jgi:hypothetical protein
MSLENQNTGGENSFLEDLFNEGQTAGSVQNQKTDIVDNGGGSQAQTNNGQPASNESKIQVSPKEIFGEDFEDDWEKVKTNVQEWRTAANQLSSSREELEKVKSIQQNPFANDEIAGYNQFVKETGISNFNTYQYIKGLNLSEADPVEIMVANEIIQNPSLIGKEAGIRSKIIRENGLNEQEYSSEEIEVNKASLMSKVNPLIEKIKGYQDNKFIAPSVEEIENARKNALSEVEPEIISSISDVATLPIMSEAQDGNKTKLLDYTIDAARLSEKAKKITNTLVQNGYSKKNITQEVKNAARQAAINEIMVEDFSKIIHSAVKQAETQLAQKLDAELHNPSAINKGGNAKPLIYNADSEEQFINSFID